MRKILSITLLIFSVFSCKKDIDDTPNGGLISQLTPEQQVDLQIKNFIWKGLNSYYLWQADVPNLADTRFAPSLAQTNFSNKEYVDFLRGSQAPDDFFHSLLNKSSKFYKEGYIDRFSFITNDYLALEQSFAGVVYSSGMDFALSRYGSQGGVFGVVRYVLPDTDAAQKGIKRGDVFIQVDGQALTVNNYRQLLFNDKTSMVIDINRIQMVNNQPTIVSENRTVTMEKKSIKENPVHISKVIEKGNHKVGYLMYNSFVADFDLQLNEAFAVFKSEGITDLVLDLRYNGGGRVSSAVYLASMITGLSKENVFARERWNDKLQPAFKDSDITNYFADKIIKEGVSYPINSLSGLSRIYILTTNRTASASELVINGLKPYMSVIQIGGTTTGKNQGSITLYDSPAGYNKKDINPNHKWAMQPLVLKIVNKDGKGDYTNGITPDYIIEEDWANFGELGQETEPFLAKALELITGINVSGKSMPTQPLMPAKPLADSKTYNFGANEMYK
ncbi:S41 family peptidase [Capnocytophaga sp. H2931]|uniref:S41 family peptidase n=1 Tax=Capnocytophaga sp. H2931 TaxID=1945657 RepID=UPI000BB1F5C6|nr:S41 family peptidase [Capnocytophaga sp. H2931]ATA74267.1 carboxyl-terminal-processing protease [Capnocytophaga sp. H2931]